MQVLNLKADPNPRGGRIDLAWTNPTFTGTGNITILRRESAYPVVPPVVPNDIGTDRDLTRSQPLSASSGEPLRFSDSGLKPETVYYYAVIARDSASPQDEPAFVSAMATAAYETAEHLYRRLPALYQRHDTVLQPEAPTLDPADWKKGQLRRLMELFGLPLDLLRSFASGMRDFSNVDRIDGELLRLLAQWIGWQNDFTLPLDKRRNEIKYAPHYYRTTATVANLRATINRLTTWDTQFKEFMHNVFRSNNPEALTLREARRQAGTWLPGSSVTLDVAYEGKPAVIAASDGRQVLIYHARQGVPPSRLVETGGRAGEQWHLWYKILDQDRWMPARRLTADGEINRYPAAVQTRDANCWVFWSSYEAISGTLLPRLRLSVLAAGRAAGPARIMGTKKEPFSLSDGDSLTITIQDSGGSFQRLVAFHPEDFLDIAHDISHAEAAEVAEVLNRELPGVEASVSDDGGLILTSIAQGSAAVLTVLASAGATKLGLSGAASGIAAESARLCGRLSAAPTLAGKRLVLRLDQGPARSISFTTETTATDVAKTINAAVSGLARADTATNTITLTSPTSGEHSGIIVDVDLSTVAPELGFGAALPPAAPPADDIEPAAFEDAVGNVWLFWSSRRGIGRWKLWYTCFDISTRAWGTARPLTSGLNTDREPAALFDPALGKLQVFWSRKKENGLWNIFYRAAKNLNFSSHPVSVLESGDPAWEDVAELTPVPAASERREPSPLLLAGGSVELFFSSNRTTGWNVWSNAMTTAGPSVDDTMITSGQFTQRAPAAAYGPDGTVRLYFRSNESEVYTSPLYHAAVTSDERYSGSTTVDTRNPAKISQQKSITDILHYTYDTGKEEEDWYARDTIGIYLTPSTNDERLVIRKQRQIQNVLRRFLPIQVRAVFIVQRGHDEFVYTYDDPAADPQVRIGEQMVDTILGEVYPGVEDSHRTIADFRWLRTWSAALTTPGKLPDLTESPPDLSARLPVKGVEEGE